MASTTRGPRPDPYVLSDASRRGWESALDRMVERGDWVKIARALDRELCFGDARTEGSWKTQLSDFKKGTKKGLRAFFEAEDRRLEIVASSLGSSPEELRQLLAQARSGARPDAHDEVRLAGFEELGPLPLERIAIAPPVASIAWSPEKLPAGVADQELSIEALTNTLEHARGPIVVAFVGESGIGKTFLLRWLGARLRDRGLSVELLGRGGPVGEEAASSRSPSADAQDVALIDDYDSRKDTLAGARIALVTARCESDLIGLPEQRVIYRLGRGRASWSARFVEKLAPLARQLLGHSVDFGRLVRQLDSDPVLAAFAGRPEVLGLLARAAAEGSMSHPSPSALLDGVLSRGASSLRLSGRGAAAGFVEAAGAETLGALGELMLAESKAELGLAEVARVVAEVGREYGVELPEGRSLGSFPLVEALVDARLLRRQGAGLCPSPFDLAVAAVGRRLDLERGPSARLLLRPDWHHAFVVAAERSGDVAPVLSFLFRQPAPSLAAAMGLVTKLLAGPIPCSDDAIWVRCFRASLGFWLRWRPELTPSEPEPSPLLCLAVAAEAHRSLLPERVDAEFVESVPSVEALGEGLAEYLELCGARLPGRRETQLVLEVVMPRASRGIEDDDLWRAFKARGIEGRRLLLGALDFEVWWELVAAPILAESASGRALVAGERPGLPISTFMLASGRGRWVSMLQELPADALARAFARAVRVALDHPRPEWSSALAELWDHPAAPRARMQELTTETLVASEPPGHWSEPRLALLSWILSRLGEGCDKVLESWVGKLGRRLPFEAFLEAGASPKLVARTLAADGAEGGPHFQRAVDACDEETLAELFVGASASVAATIAGALAARGSRRARLRLAACADASLRHALLSDLLPEPDEEDSWLALVPRAATPAETLLRTAQAWLAGSVRPDGVAEALSRLDELLMSESRPDPSGGVWSPLSSEIETFDDDVLHEISMELEVSARLSDLIAGLERALSWERRPDGLERVVEALILRPTLTRLVRGPELWSVALRVLGRSRLMDALPRVEGVSRRSGVKREVSGGGAAELLEVLWSWEDRRLVHQLLHGPHASAAARAASSCARNAEDLALALDACWPSGGRPSDDPVFESLLSASVSRFPAQTLELLQTRIPTLHARAWWGWVVPRLAHGPDRIRAWNHFRTPPD